MATKTLIAATVAALSLSAAASAELRDTYIWHNDGRFQVKQIADEDGSQGCMLLRGAGNGRGFSSPTIKGRRPRRTLVSR